MFSKSDKKKPQEKQVIELKEFKKYQIFSTSDSPRTSSELARRTFDLLKDIVILFKEKYSLKDYEGEDCLSARFIDAHYKTVSFTFTNSQFNCKDSRVDTQHEAPIQLLCSYEIKVTKAKHHHEAWSYTIIELNTDKLVSLKQKLQRLPDPKSKHNQGIAELHKEIEKETIYDVTSNFVIPEKPLLDHCMLELLKQLVCLIEEKFDTKKELNLHARFSNANYNEAILYLLINPSYENQILKLTLFLTSCKAKLSIAANSPHNLKDPVLSLYTFQTANLVKLKEKLEGYTEEDKVELEEEVGPRI